MKTMLDADHADLDEHERSFVDNIKTYGWMRTSVLGDDEGPEFSYTTGFWREFGFPEMIVFSMKIEIAHDVFWQMHQALKEGGKFSIGAPTEEIFENLDSVLLPVSPDEYKNYLGWSPWFYRGTHFSCLQLVWPDRAGVFPWQPGFDREMDGLQVDLSGSDWGGLSGKNPA